MTEKFGAAENLTLKPTPHDPFNRSFDKSKLKLKQKGGKARNMLGGALNIETDNMGGTGNYDKEINDMGKTSNFGGHLPSAQLPSSPTGSRLLGEP